MLVWPFERIVTAHGEVVTERAIKPGTCSLSCLFQYRRRCPNPDPRAPRLAKSALDARRGVQFR